MRSGRPAAIFEISEHDRSALVVDDSESEELRRRFAAECGVPEGLRLVVSGDNGLLREQTVVGPYAIIGSAPQCDLRLDDASVSPRHAVVLALEGRVFACDLASESGTRQNGQPLTKAWFDDAPLLEIGAATVTLASMPLPFDQDPEESADSGDAFRLEIALGPGRPWYRVRGQAVLFGRDPRCKVQCQHESAEPVHGLLVCTRTSAWLVDLGTPEGTTLDGKAVRLAPLKDGSIITLGHRHLHMRVVRPTQASEGADSPAAASEALVLELLQVFQDSQRQLLDEMRHWAREFAHTLRTGQHAQAQQLLQERQDMHGEFAEMLRLAAVGRHATQGSPARADPAVHPSHEEPFTPAPSGAPALALAAYDPGHVNPAAADDLESSDAQVAGPHAEEPQESQRGWLDALLRRAPR